MTYKIISTRVNDETITTEVEYNFDGAIVIVDVAHFAPQNESDIETGILNRALGEKKKLDAIEFNKTFITTITIGEEKTI